MSALRARARIIGVFALATSHVVYAQRAPTPIGLLDHTVWTVRDGAPSFINSLAQTTDGVLWMGTNSGLYRFDGLRFEQFEPPPKQPFPPVAISTMKAMPDGSLWVGFVAGNVRVVTRDRVISYKAVGAGLPGGRINGIVRDSAGDTWVASMNGLVRLHDGRWQQMGRDQHYPGGGASSLFVDSRGALWIPMEIGLYVLPRGETQFVRQAASPDAKQGGFRTPAEAPDGSIWGVSLALGLSRLSDSAGQPVVPRSEVNGVSRSLKSYVDRHGNVWISAGGAGVMRVRLPTNGDRSRPTIEKVPLVTATNGPALLEDADGNMWVATGGGLERFRQTALTPLMLPKDARWPGLAADSNGSIWMSSYSHPISLITDQLEPQVGAPGSITCVLRDLDGGLWFGGGRGIWHLSPSKSAASGQFIPVALPREGTFGPILAMARTLDGDLWVSNASLETMRGVFRLRRGVWSRAPLPALVSHEPSLTIMADSADQVWLGSGNKLIRVRGDSARVYLDSAHFRPGVITALQLRGHRLWIGGKTGLAVMEDEHIRPIIATTAIRNVTGIVATANGDVWLNGSSGITHITAAEVRRALSDSLYRVRGEHFDEHDGLSGLPVETMPRPTAIQGGDGRLWFTTSTSVAWIDPANITRHPKAPPVQVRALTVAGKSYDVAHRVSLPLRTTQLQLLYTAINLVKPNRVAFRYMLSGVDTAWVEADTRREAFYTNLKPGSYRFRVSAANEDGVWNEAGASVDFEIPPSFTQTKAFMAMVVGLIAVTLLAAGWLLALLRHRQMARALRANFEGQLAERARVARELHDTLLGDITGVGLQLNVAAQRAASANVETKFVELLSGLSRQIQQTLVEARRSVSAIRATPDELPPLHQQLAETAQRLFNETGIAARVVHTGSPRTYSPTVESQIVGIASEAMANARRHAHCQTVTITCEYARRDVHVRVRDDGRGFDSSRATPNGHWGLVGMRERAELIGAELSVASTPGMGTEVLLATRVERAT